MTRWDPDRKNPGVCRYCGERLAEHYRYAIEQQINSDYYPCPGTPKMIDVPL